MNRYIFYSWFTSEFLQQEFARLFELFVPHEEVPDVRIVVGDESPNGESAHALLDLGIVVMYADYHIRRPEEYKMTLLHEAGHFLFDSESHDDFSGYFSLLKRRQKFIKENVLPNHLEDFVYCSKSQKVEYTFACSGCGDRTVSTCDGITCAACDRNMLLVGGL